MSAKRYSDKEPLVFLWIAPPYIFFMNLLMFGGCIFQSFRVFALSFLISTLYFFLIYGVFGSIAVIIKNRFPGAGDLFKRVSLLLPVFYFMNNIAILGAYHFYYWIDWLGDCQPRPFMFWWTYLYGCIMSTVITFINEGMANWDKWKDSLAEGEKLTNAYQRSKLLGLKGQINPHFLFNCFNTLSGLIQDNTERAEDFLDEMTKVHRYLLRGDDEYLVSLGDELKFASSYLYLTKARFGDSMQVHVRVSEERQSKFIPPLTMQVILENIIYNNVLSKKTPLIIQINSPDADHLLVRHSVQEKTIVQNMDTDEGLDNLINKYRLLSPDEIMVKEMDREREILIPLFNAATINA